MAFFWIIAGVVYVLYKLHKEEKIFTKESSLLIGLFVVWGVLPWVVANAIWGETIADLVQMIVFFIPMLCICIYMIVSIIKTSPKTQKVKLGNDVLTIQNNLAIEFRKNGYEVCQEDIEFIVKHPRSPLYDNNKTVSQCYLWLCEQKTWEINSLTKKQIEELLGVPLDVIPLDKSIPSDEALFKRTLAAKQYLLKRRGLSYREFGGTAFQHYLNDEEYLSNIDEFIKSYLSEHH